MKTLLTALILVISTSAFAQFDMQQTEMDRTVAQINNVSAAIKTVKLNESGVLIVVPVEGLQKTMKLTATNGQALLNSARTLVEAQVTTDKRFAICEMVVNQMFATNLNVIDLDTNSLRLVLSPAGCSYAQYTHPADQASLTLAQNLKSQMTVLAQQVISQ
ncbi:MAG: hypothetical protein ACXVAX_10835 [Pseudobdellovibrio sp.]